MQIVLGLYIRGIIFNYLLSVIPVAYVLAKRNGLHVLLIPAVIFDLLVEPFKVFKTELIMSWFGVPVIFREIQRMIEGSNNGKF